MLSASSHSIISDHNINKIHLHNNHINSDDYSDHSPSNSTQGIKPEVGIYGFQLEDYKVSEKVKDYINTEDNYEFCPNCQRKFFLGRLKLHMKSCKEGKPLKLKKNIEGGIVNFNSPLIKQSAQSSISNPMNLKEDIFSKDIKENVIINANVDVNDDEDDGIGIVENRNEHGQNDDIQDKDNRISCLHCKRLFNSSRIEKHENACAKSQKKRVLFDTKKQRVYLF